MEIIIAAAVLNEFEKFATEYYGNIQTVFRLEANNLLGRICHSYVSKIVYSTDSV
jgi:hypothetical protein